MRPGVNLGDATETDQGVLIETLQATALALAMAAACIAPRALPVLLVCLALLAIVAAVPHRRSGAFAGGGLAGLVLRQRPLQAALALLCFAGLSALWASDPRLALGSVLQVGAVVLATGTVTALMPLQLGRTPAPRCIPFLRGALIGGIGVTGWGMWQPWLVAAVGLGISGLWVSWAAGERWSENSPRDGAG